MKNRIYQLGVSCRWICFCIGVTVIASRDGYDVPLLPNGIAMHTVKPTAAHPSKNADTKITGGTVLRERVQPPVTEPFDIKSGIAGFPH